MQSTKLVTLWALAAAPALLATPCMPGTLASYIALGSSGCTDGIYNVEDFAFNVISTTLPITASNINVTPLATSNSATLLFSSPLFNVSGTNSIDVQIGYFWDSGDIGSLSEVMSDPPLFPGESSIAINACENATFVNSFCPTTLATALLFDDQEVRNLTATIIFPPGVTSVGMLDSVYLAGNGTGSADITSFSDTLATPEPATLLLVAVGAAVLFAWSRRTRARAHSDQPLL